ncbi:MAG: carbohydrate binding family 9 domain-containing protein [Acidobacteria bacterium]|nr:carbohydrate binding family 9 domain-containing protein [Acidobacteriota bacterium]
MTALRRFVCVLALFAAPAAPAAAQVEGGRAVARATRIADPVSVDGVLDEPFWERLPPVTGFVQREPVEGAPVSERTEVRVAYDDRNLYFGFNLYDAEPSRIVRSVLQREGPSQNDDHVMIGLDTYHDRRNAYIFGLNPFGTQEDAIITDEGQPEWNWEGVYASAARITSSGWTLEVAIPFSTIRLANVPDPTMGIAFYRQIRRKNEEATWPAIGRDFRNQFFQVSQYGTLEGLSGIAAGRNLQIKPYVFLGARNPAVDLSPSTEITRNAGADLRYAVTSNATLDLTYNTDFAQAEADNAQLNLTRFSVFFPEKRDFFLERNGLFAFGAPGNQSGFRQQLEAATFFSRRIGLNQPVLGGARYSGRSGILTMGYLDIQTRDEGALQGRNFGVARVKADISPRRTIGAIFTNVQGGGEDPNRAAGADLAFRFMRSSAITAWISNVWDRRYSASTAAGNVDLLLRNDRYSYQFDYLNVGRNFDPAIGYVRRLDMVRHTHEVGFHPRPAGGAVRQFHVNVGGFQIFGQDGRTQSTNGYLKFAANMQSGDEVGGAIAVDTDRPASPFQIVSATLPAGHYAYTHPRLYVNTSDARRISEQFSWETGGFYGGTKTSYTGLVNLKIKPQLQVSYNFQRDAISLPVAGGLFATQLHGVNLFVAANRNLYSNSLLQYDNVSRRFQANIRIRWIHRPGSDLFLVFNTSRRFAPPGEPREADDDQRAGILKLTYLIGF